MKQKKDIIIVGFALFSVFFGASNLIFPPFIGVTSGSEWLTSFLGFVLGDVGIILLSIYAIAKCGDYQSIVGRAGKNFGLSLEIIMMLCLGPILTLILTIRPTKVMDIIGKFLTPVLLICLAFLIGKGMISPLGTLNNEIESNELFVTGLTQGYQTMDALGVGGITAFMIASFIGKGYTSQEERIKLTINATILACCGLALIYGGLTYLGATVSNQFDASVSQTALLVAITHQLMGQSGTIILGIIVALACLTTAIGLTSITSKYFEDVTNKKLKYEHIAICICTFSTIASTIGVDQIIALSVPILTIIYPVSIILVILSVLKKFFSNNLSFVFAGYTTLLISALSAANVSFMNELPLANLGLNWLLPSLLVAIVGEMIGTKKLLTVKSPIKEL